MYEFESWICPGASRSSTGVNSSPLDSNATRGLRYTERFATPSVASKPISCARKRVPANNILRPDLDIHAARADILACLDAFKYFDGCGCNRACISIVEIGIFDHDDGIRAFGNGSAGHDARQLVRAQA